MAGKSSNQKVANGLVAMSAAAILAVYSAGYVRTRPAADRLAKQALERTFARQAPPREAAPDGTAANPAATVVRGEPSIETAAAPAPPVHTDPKRTTAPEPNVTAAPTAAQAAATTAPVSATASTNAPAQVAIANPAPSPMETPAPAAVPVSTPVTSVAPVVEPPANVAAAVPAAASTPAATSAKAWKDGKYVAWGGSRHGDIQATVVIESGQIVSAVISECQTRYSCDVIDRLPPQVIKRQSPNVDRVSGATESADAFYSAVYFALGQAH